MSIWICLILAKSLERNMAIIITEFVFQLAIIVIRVAADHHYGLRNSNVTSCKGLS